MINGLGLVVCLVAVYGVGYALWLVGWLPFVVLATLFLFWIMSFVDLDHVIASGTLDSAQYRRAGWSCFATSVALAVCALVVL